MKPYYYIYKHGDQGPRVRHSDLPTAQNEAERLAAKEPGQCFEILQCLGYASTSKVSTFWMDGEGPPEKPRWRDMEIGETFQDGDQFFITDKWVAVPPASFGFKINGTYRFPHRRPL